MSAADADRELARLLDAYGQAEYNVALRPATGLEPTETPAYARSMAARAALLDYLERAYVRREDAEAAAWQIAALEGEIESMQERED